MINGIRVEKRENATLCTFENFSDEFKEIIRSNLTNICIGKQKAESSPVVYSYEDTLDGFFQRFEKKSLETQLGMIGELLSHIIVLELNKKLTSVNPYYNMEEKSIKKGFDLVLFDIDMDYKMWITEVKAGELGKVVSSDKKNYRLLGAAKCDLSDRLNNGHDAVWNNAINGAYVAMEENDHKNAVIKILENSLVDSRNQTISSDERNVILTSVLFNEICDPVDINTIHKFCNKTECDCTFNDLIVISIHKNTVKCVIDFLKSEVTI